MEPSSDKLTNDNSPTRGGLIDLIRRNIPACVAGIALSLTGCSVQADSAPKQTAEITASAQPDAEPSPTPIDQAETLQASHLEVEMQAYLDALQDPNGVAELIRDKLQESSTTERTAKPEILKSAPVFDIKNFNLLEDKSLEGFKLSELGINLGDHPELQKDGVSLVDLYNSFILVKDPTKGREEWFDDGARDVIATYYSQLAAAHNAPFGPETTKELKALLAKDPNSLALALPMIEREVALTAAITRDYGKATARLKEMVATGFKDQIAMTTAILNRPPDQLQDPKDPWPVEVFVNNINSPYSPYGTAWTAGSVHGKNPTVPSQGDNKYPGAVMYTLQNRVHGTDLDGKVVTPTKKVTALVVDVDTTGEATLIPGTSITRPLPKVPSPKGTTSKTNGNRIG